MEHAAATPHKTKRSFHDRMQTFLEQARLACGGAIFGICLFHIFDGDHGNDTNDLTAGAFGATYWMVVLHFDSIKSVLK